jgi:heme A synthase
LGILTVLLRKPADIASAHVAVGSLLLVTTCVIAVRAMRLLDPTFASSLEANSARTDLQYAVANE